MRWSQTSVLQSICNFLPTAKEQTILGVGFPKVGNQSSAQKTQANSNVRSVHFRSKRMMIPYKYGGYCAEKGRFVSSCQNNPHKNFVRVY